MVPTDLVRRINCGAPLFERQSNSWFEYASPYRLKPVFFLLPAARHDPVLQVWLFDVAAYLIEEG